MAKVAVITGGSKGIGWGISKKLAKEGFSLVIMGTSSEESNRSALEYLEEIKVPFLYVQGNIANSLDRQKLLEQTLSKFGRIDVLVNNAGVGPLVRNDILEMSEESFDRVININLKGTTFLSQIFAKQMISQEAIQGLKGIIINIASISSTVASISRGEYCMSKAGISMLTMLLASRLTREGIMVYEVRPGIIATRITETVKEKYDEICSSDELLVKRWGQPEDVAEVVSILSSGKLIYSPGQVITIDGGFTIRRL